MKKLFLAAALLALAVPAAMAKNDALSLVPNDAVTVGVVHLTDLRTSPLGATLFKETDKISTDGDAEKFLRAVDAHRPDAVVVDVRMPPTFTDEGLRAALMVRDRWPDTGVLVLSQWVEERYATELISGRPQGVGYLLKDRVADVAEFLDALHRVAAGGSALDPEVVAQLLARSRHPLGELTPREREVLALMAEGRSNSAIAGALVVGGGAVEKHINNIFTKLGLAPGDRDHRRVLAVLHYLGT